MAAKAKRVQVKPATEPEEEALAGPPIVSATPAADTGPAVSGVFAVFAALVGVGLLLLGVSAVPPQRVPWVVIAEPLFLYRSSLAAFGIGAIALAFLCLNIAVLF